MMRHIHTLIAALIILLNGAACQRQTLEDPDLSLAYIPISIDWSESLLESGYTANVSIYFYPTDGGEPYVTISDDIYFALAKVPVGEYSVLIFNDIYDNLSGVKYADENSYKDISTKAVEVGATSGFYHDVTTDEKLVSNHDRVAAWRIDNYVVSDDMVSYTRTGAFEEVIEITKSKSKSRAESAASRSDEAEADDKIIYEDATRSLSKALDDLANVVPTPITTIINLNIRVLNLNSAESIECIMKGTAAGSYLSSESKIVDSSRDVIYIFNLTNRSYDDPENPVDGVVTYTLNTFGRLEEDETYEMEFNIILSTGELKTITRDVTEQMTSEMTLTIDINLDEESDTHIELPESLEPGFSVGDWGDQEIIPMG